MDLKRLRDLEEKLKNKKYWYMDMYLHTVQINDIDLEHILECIKELRYLQGDNLKIDCNKDWSK
jgi:hypothetical protein